MTTDTTKLEQFAAEMIRPFQHEIDRLNELLNELLNSFMRGEIEAASILPPDQTCSCLAFPSEAPFVASWSCERADCLAGRPSMGVTVAQLVGGK